MSEILPGIYVGNASTARDAEFFSKQNIVKVVNCTPDLPFYFPNDVECLRIPVYDADDVENNAIMTRALPKAVSFILQDPVPSVNRGVLIHCHAGISRSCTVAVAVLRVCCARSLRHAISLCLSRRSIAFFGGTVINFWRALETVFHPDRINNDSRFLQA